MTTYPETICAQEAARLLGIEPRRIKQLVRDRHLFTIPLPEGGRAIPREILVKAADGWEPLFSLPGTLTLLADGGFTEDEAAASRGSSGMKAQAFWVTRPLASTGSRSG